MGEEDQYYILKNHEAIIDGKQFDDVQKILKDRCSARTKFGFNATKEISNKLITEKSKINIEDKNVILDFVNTRRFFSYERDENGKLNKVLRNGLRIRVECGNIENNWLQN